MADVAHLGRRSVSHIDQDAVPGLVPPVWQAVDPHLCDPSRIHCASVVGRADDDAAVAELAVLDGVARSMQHHQRVELAVARYGREQALRLKVAADGVGVRGELPPPYPPEFDPPRPRVATIGSPPSARNIVLSAVAIMRPVAAASCASAGSSRRIGRRRWR